MFFSMNSEGMTILKFGLFEIKDILRTRKMFNIKSLLEIWEDLFSTNFPR